MTDQIASLLDIMTALRDRETGCPWDVEQTFETIAPYTIEEAYEVDDAIRGGDRDELRDELGDLLLQVVFHAQIAREEGSFTFDDVAKSVGDKMIRRHPHVFAHSDERDIDQQTVAWEEQKQIERQEKATASLSASGPISALDGVASALPALMRAQKLQKRAARVGFDWPNTIHVLDKIKEESDELLEAYTEDQGADRLHEEYGDLLFVMVNLGRHLGLDSETALRHANSKFTRRFKGVESALHAKGSSPEQSNLEEMDDLWNQVKRDEKG